MWNTYGFAWPLKLDRTQISRIKALPVCYILIVPADLKSPTWLTECNLSTLVKQMLSKMCLPTALNPSLHKRGLTWLLGLSLIKFAHTVIQPTTK